MSKFIPFRLHFKLLILISLVLFSNHFNISYSQSAKIILDWNEDSVFLNNKSLKIPKQLIFDLKSTKISFVSETSQALDLVFKSVEYEDLSKSDINFLQDNLFKIDTSFSFNFNNSYDKDRLFLTIEFSSFVVINKKYFRVKSVEYEVYNKNTVKHLKRGSTLNSVLSDEESKWFKFRVKDKGFYKITYNQLKSLGLNPGEITFNSLHVYGNSTGKLPELNSDYEDVDLIQNHLIHEGAEDGVFDEKDAIVFYSPGPNKLQYDGDGFLYRDLNIYSDYSSYFLRVSSKISPKVALFKDNLNLITELKVDNYQHHSVHELEDTSLVYAGKRWYGEVLDFEKSLELNFEGFQTNLKDLTIMISGATNSRISGSYLNIYLDDKFTKKINLPSVSSEYIRLENKIYLNSNSGFGKIKIELVRNNPDTKFFLDKVEINAFKNIIDYEIGDILANSKILDNSTVQFELPISVNGKVIDVTNPTKIAEISSIKQSNYLIFRDSTKKLNFYTFYNFSSTLDISSNFTPIKPQNLHLVDLVDMIIVTPLEFLNQANELKQIHIDEGLRVVVVTDSEIYNEFSSGEMDPTAIKQFARSVYLKQKNNSADRLKYLLLFGDGTFDYKNRIKGNNNFIPTYQFDASEDFLSAMVSDDYFGMMDDTESLKGSDLLDIGVGRMLISSQRQAEEMITKVKEYIKNNQKQTDWKSKVVLIADDEEGGYFINNDAEPQAKYLNQKHAEINVVKLYSDAFQQVTTAGGERYPSLNSQIDNQFYNGALVISYVGHGGPSGAAEERIISLDQVSNYKNLKNLPLFMSSTCEFTKYDDPTRISAGEVLYLNPSGGAIALMTTTRPVFFGVNSISGSSFYKNVLLYDSITNSPLTFGEIIRRTKNQSGTSSNRRSFTLIGDPGLRINYPYNKIIIDSINKKGMNQFLDTLKALSKVSISGRVSDREGNEITDDGNLFLTLYDKKNISSTLGQNVESPLIKFENQNSILFKGLVSINKGRFNVDFILPKDIDYSIGKGKISVVSYTDKSNGIGYCDSFLIGGLSSFYNKDSIGPQIVLSLDSIKQIDNGTFSTNPILYIKLKDDSGINISSSGIGHQISLVIDDKDAEAVDLNSYYISDKDTYMSGKIQYLLTNLSSGMHKVRVKAWDVHNNSSEKELMFSINNAEVLGLNRIFNFPNPFTTSTSFYIEQNLLNVSLDVKLEVFTVSGKLVKELVKQNIQLRSNVDSIFDWDGKDQFGDQLAKGVYIYRISLSNDKTTTTKMEKLVIF